MSDKSSDWIEWKGGDSPVKPGTLIRMKFRDGFITNECRAGWFNFRWRHRNDRDDIIAYRLVSPQEQG